MMYSKIFLELNPQNDNTSAETTLIEQHNEVCHKVDKNPEKTSSHSKTGISKKLMVQTDLPYMHSKQVYTCPHCLVCVSSEWTYTNHVETYSKYNCPNVIKLCSVCMHLISTNITVLLKDIHVKFVKKITLDSLMLIKYFPFGTNYL